jgi:amidase
MPGCDAFGISTGPMCASLRDIDLFMNAIRNSQPHLLDPTLYPQPWSIPAADKKLRVGIMRHDGEVLPQPPMLRAFDEVVKKLAESDAIELVDFEPYKQREGYDILVSLSLRIRADSAPTLL